MPNYLQSDQTSEFQEGKLTERLLPAFSESNPSVTRTISQERWKTLRTQHRLHGWNTIAEEWPTYNIFVKFLLVLEAPLIVMRDLTIPSTDPTTWCKSYIVLHPIFCPLLLLLATGNLSLYVGDMPAVVLCPMLGSLGSIVLYLSLHRSKPPKNGLFTTALIITSFIMCVAWVYVIASELVTCLSSTGILLSVSPSVLGLSVLAWGNSIGDLFANLSVARNGMSEMALSGCYAGPNFNLMIGLGSSLSIACYLSYPHPFRLVADSSSLMSIAYLLWVLLSTLAIAYYYEFKLKKWLGYYLLTLYAIYTLAQVVNLFLL